MQTETFRRRLILDWLVPLAGLAVLLAVGFVSWESSVDRSLGPLVGPVLAAMSSWRGGVYVCLLVTWWIYRLAKHGSVRDAVRLGSIVLQLTGMFFFFESKSPVTGVMFAGVGLLLWGLAPPPSPRHPPTPSP